MAMAQFTSTSTIRSALRQARARLMPGETADLDAQILLAHVLEADRSFLFAHGDDALDSAQLKAFECLLARRAKGEPIAYILGQAAFYDLELIVSPAVLIPRPETELLLEAALRLIIDMPGAVIADIGTGSGALAIAYQRQRPQSQVHASDISADALAIAGLNAARHQADIRFHHGSLAQPLIEQGIHVDLLLANLPYIESKLLSQLDVSRWEPRLALDGGRDGLRLIGELLGQLRSVCKPGAYVLLEIGADQAPAMRGLARDRLGVEADILQDYAGLDRIAALTLP